MNTYLGPWVWQDGDRPHWAPPAGSAGALDLRGLTAQGRSDGTPGIGVFVCDTPLGSDYTLLAEHPLAQVTAHSRSAWRSATGFQPQGARLIDLVWDQYTRGSDPEGETAPKPLMPGKQGNAHWFDLYLGGRVRSEPFAWGEDPDATERVRDMLRRAFRGHYEAANAGQLRDAEGRPDFEHHLRILDFWCEQYGMDWQEFVPPDLRPHVPGPLPHKTSFSYDFNQSDSDSLGGSWTEVAGDTDIVSNQARGPVNQSNFNRWDADLSSADHYAQLLGVSVGVGQGVAPCARFAAAATTCYLYLTDGGRLFKVVAAAFTNIGSGGGTPSLPITVKVQANGSSITGYYSGTQQVSATDTAITGNTRCGFRIENCTIDDWAASDLAAGGILYTQLERGVRGVERGVYTRF